jgi:hypothetical protein
MRLESPPHFVEIRITEILSDQLPRAGDLRLEVEARIGGFSGDGHCWVGAPDFLIFSAQLSQLYENFKGVARLESMSPGQLSFSLSPANSRGYVQVKVGISRLMPVKLSMTGEFAIELGSLASAVAWAEAKPITKVNEAV